MEFEELAKKYYDFQANRSNLNMDDFVAEAKKFLEELRISGKFISNPQERDVLSAWCRDLGGKIYEVTGEYPAVRISPSIKIMLSTVPPSSAIVPHQIPPPPRDFTGREENIRNILEAFNRDITIIVLQGMEGIGKTALALVLGDKLKAQFPDGQIFINLLGTSKNPLTPADAMAHVIRTYLGADARIPVDLDELGGLYRSVLSGKRTLILLDNAANRGQVEPLLPPSQCSLIITSQNKFALPGSEENQLDVLPPKDAKKLLLIITERIGDQAEELARLCGCLPLALRNAAYALKERKDLGVTEYLERLKVTRNRVELVEASFGLVYDLLLPRWQRQWTQLSVFPADFNRIGAVAVWDMDLDDSGEALSNFVKWSLVEFNSVVDRYRLHDLARDFAASCLEASAKVEAQQRHAEHYRNVLSLSDELYKKGGGNVLTGLQLFDIEEANIRAGHAWAEKNLEANSFAAELCKSYPAVGTYVLDLRLHPLEMISWLKTALAAARQLEDRSTEGVHLGNLGLAYADLGDVQRAIEYFDQQLTIAKEIGDRKSEGNALGNLGSAYYVLGDALKAIVCYEQRLAIARAIGDLRGEGNALGNLGLAYYALDDARKAITQHQQALAIDREIGDQRGEGIDLGNLGLAYYALGDARKAIEYYEQALAIARNIGDKRGEGAALGNLGSTYYALGDVRKAINYHEQALAIARDIGDKRGEGADLGNLGAAYASLGDAPKAIKYFEQHLAIAREIRDRRGESNALDNLGLAYASLDNARKAIEYYEQALSIAREIRDRRGESNALGNLGLAYASLDNARKAIEYYEQALVIDRDIGDKRGEGADLGNLGSAYFTLGDWQQAEEFYRSQHAIAQEIGDRRQEANALWGLAIYSEKKGDLSRAIAYAEEAMKIFEEIESPSAQNMCDLLKTWKGD